MRLLSFCNLVETTLAMLRPDDAASGWSRRADYEAGAATCWHAGLGLSLSLRCCALADGRFSLQAVWHGPAGQALADKSFFCGSAAYEWQAAADAVAEAMPEPVLHSLAEPDASTDDALASARSARLA